MSKILYKEKLNSIVSKMEVDAPLIARKAKPGQFIILRVSKKGERIPLTIYDCDKQKGTVSIIYQVVGKTTTLLDKLNVGDDILNFIGPLGRPSEIYSYDSVLVVGGGVGCAVVYNQAKALHDNGCYVDVIMGFKNKDTIILEDDVKKVCDTLKVMTDDGSNGNKGFVTDAVLERLNSGKKYDVVITIGPLVMMKAVCELTKKFSLKTIVSMNPIMIDGTGMCGGCRLTFNGETKFACIDGPDFDGHGIDFDEVIRRNNIYRSYEQNALHRLDCKLLGGE